jgi:hypothetical protein
LTTRSASPLIHFVCFSACALAFAGCRDRPTTIEKTLQAPPGLKADDAPFTDAWLGQWDGPEGTFLRLAGGSGDYLVKIQNLDGPRTFLGKAVGKEIQFERDGVMETLRPTNGDETGMKWLAGKSNCLTVRPGEGYCRDGQGLPKRTPGD